MSRTVCLATGHIWLSVYSSSAFERVHMVASPVDISVCSTPVGTNACCWSPPVSSALGDVDQLLDAPRVGQSLGVLHVFAGDLVQGATDGRHRLVRQQGGVSPGEPVDQVPHRILS